MSEKKDPKNPVINVPDAPKYPQGQDVPQEPDRRYLVPEVSMAPGWEPPPSFNLDPPEPKGGDQPPKDYTGPMAKPFSVDLGSMRTGEKNMLAALHTEVDQYQSLRGTVMGAVDNPKFFGPEVKKRDTLNDAGSYSNSGATVENQNTGSDPRDGTEENNALAKIGAEFAAQINPVQEKLLKSIGDTLELAGSFITMLNKAGQSYSKTDRSSNFPNPPGGSPVT
ncbi:hypothetical protein [Pseudonocardia spinosispora]|uniref:hypothetical protein n=1 Tax=Pseudonocardia spinosispora TaxID=103441 RepID=UPI0012EB6E14|nr:hypothetical protein [Pseudonocardia spinosispora]